MAALGFPKPSTTKETTYEKILRYRENHIEKLKLKKKEKKKRKALPSIRSLIRIADRVFSIFIRRRDGRCVLCGSTSNLTCGHLIKRGKKRVRWDERNCNCLCSGCNYRDNFDHDIYVLWWINRYGLEEYKWMVVISKPLYKPTRDELNSIILKYNV